jgi:hypothetical protein
VTQFFTDSLGATATVTAPTAGQAIAAVTIPTGEAQPGKTTSTWSVQITVALVGGTPATADLNNVQVRVDGTPIMTLLLPAAVNVPTSRTLILTAPPGQAISVNAVGAGSAGVVYAAEITAVMIR